MKNEETNYSLNNPDNYKTNMDCSVGVVTSKYVDLIIEYYNSIYSTVHIKNSTYSKYIIIRGLDTLTNVFLNILSYTKNVNLSYFHCQKAFYFYIEFIDQISDDEKTFLQLTSRDATTYVYKKTVFEINQSLKKPTSMEDSEKYKKIGNYICIFQTYLLKIINSKSNSNTSKQFVEQMKSICDKITASTNKINSTDLEIITDKMYHKIEDINIFFNISLQIVKKILRSGTNSEYIKNIVKKIESDEFSSNLESNSLEIFLVN
jgi:hypothetical protein